MNWVDWCGKMLKDKNFPVSAGFEPTRQGLLGLLAQEHNYSHTL